MAVCCGNSRKHLSEGSLMIFYLIFNCLSHTFNSTVPQVVKRDRLGLYHMLCECGECGCYSQFQCIILT